jgi:hypothetical protein
VIDKKLFIIVGLEAIENQSWLEIVLNLGKKHLPDYKIIEWNGKNSICPIHCSTCI